MTAEIHSGCYSLGLSYLQGKGVKRDITTAKKLFFKACDDGIDAGCKQYKKLKMRTGK